MPASPFRRPYNSMAGKTGSMKGRPAAAKPAVPMPPKYPGALKGAPKRRMKTDRDGDEG